MTTPTIPELAPKGPTVTESSDRARQKLVARAMGALHAQTVEAARKRVPKLNTIDGEPRAGARARMQYARSLYAKTHDPYLNRATRRTNAKLIGFA